MLVDKQSFEYQRYYKYITRKYVVIVSSSTVNTRILKTFREVFKILSSIVSLPGGIKMATEFSISNDNHLFLLQMDQYFLPFQVLQS